jgi:hypothetical protein
VIEPHADLLRAEFLGVTLRHPHVDHDREVVALLMARSGERFGLTRLEYTDAGAAMSGGDGTELVLRCDQTSAAVVTELGFREGVQRVAALLEEGMAWHAPGALGVEDITLVATWDTEEPDGARRYLRDEVLTLDAARRELLDGDDGDASHGMRVWRRLGEGTLDCSVEPMHSDPSRIYVRLVYAQEEPVDGVAAVVECAEAVNGFLHGPLVAFVRACARR